MELRVCVFALNFLLTVLMAMLVTMAVLGFLLLAMVMTIVATFDVQLNLCSQELAAGRFRQ